MFRFVQLEVPWALLPDDGRWVIRGHAGQPEWVLVVRTMRAAAAKGRLRRRGPRTVPAGQEPAPLTVTRATLIAARVLEEPGERWLAGADLEAEVTEAIAVLNGVLHVARIAAADPGAVPVTRARVSAARVGFGAGEAVAEGRWSSARAVPAPAGPRRVVHGPQPAERLAAVLGARDVILAAEDLVLRARADADAGRWRGAAFQVRVGLEAALAELEPWSGQGDMDRRLAELRDLRGPVGEAANTALQGGLTEAQVAAVETAIGLLQAAFRARAVL